MDQRPILRCNHARIPTSKVMKMKRNAVSVDDLETAAHKPPKARFPDPPPSTPRISVKPRLKRATAKNLRDIAMAEAGREHAHVRIENFDQAVMLYCGLMWDAFADRRVVQLYVYSHLRTQAARVNADEDETFTVEAAKETAKSVYDEIASDILCIAEDGERQSSMPGTEYRKGFIRSCIRSGRGKISLVLKVATGPDGLCRVLEVMTDQRFERRVLSFVREPGKGKKPNWKGKPPYINSSPLVA